MADSETLIDGNLLTARALALAGVHHIFGVVGIPVTSLAARSVSLGIRFIAFHNEQSAGYAASAYGFLTSTPGVFLTVSGPGCVHGLAGLSNATANAWPALMISGSCDQRDFGKGDFQELDQIAAVQPFAKFAARVTEISQIPRVVVRVLSCAVEGRPGGCYLDLPTDVLHQTISEQDADLVLADAEYPRVREIGGGFCSLDQRRLDKQDADLVLCDVENPGVREICDSLDVEKADRPRLHKLVKKSDTNCLKISEEDADLALCDAENPRVGEIGDCLDVEKAVGLLRRADRPLIVIGKGAAYARAEDSLKRLIETTGIPFLPTPMGKGLLPDAHELAATAARSLAIGNCDVALVVGARLNWLLHFGEPPKWSSEVKFILVDVSKEEIELRKPCLGLVGDAVRVLDLINREIKDDPFCFGKSHPWVEAISKKVKENVEKMEKQLNKVVVPFNFLTPMRIIRDAILAQGSPAPIVVSEGANTMDVGRAVLVQNEPRTRLDAGTWGTMGVGLGYCIAAAVASPNRLVVAVEGDSGFGFSAMEVETLVRYQLRVVVIVFNNGGVYGGDRRNPEEITGPYKDDPAPTSFVPNAAYHTLIEAFGGKGYIVETPEELKSALFESFSSKKPTVINVIIDPYAGAESGRMQHKN